jgi:SAM-dependent methyltransferase
MSTRLNIGCGMAPTEGWTNYDNSPAVRIAGWPGAVPALRALRLIDGGNATFAAFCRRHGIRHANAVAHIPHASGSVDAIYSSHMIEHLDRREARRFLAECRRVLKPGGILRLVVPDVRVTINDYMTKGNADVFVEHLQLAIDKPQGLREQVRMLLTGDRNHRWLYDGPSIGKLLGDAGFENVEVLPPGRTGIADPGKLDLFERAGESAYAEGMQPGLAGRG